MKVVSWLVKSCSEGRSFMWLDFSLFDLLHLSARDNDKCWVSLGSFRDLAGALIGCDVPGGGWLFGCT